MTPDRIKYVTSLSKLLWDDEREYWIPEEQWRGVLESACLGDEGLILEVLEFTRRCKWDFDHEDEIQLSLHLSQPEPFQLGRYVIDERLGEGGMGVVYKAHYEFADGSKTVALKLIKLGMDTELFVRRFRAERHLLSRLNHPNIVDIIDAGSSPEGRPYFVMKYVEGAKGLDQYCQDENLPYSSRLQLFVKVCRAVDYAHQEQVLHRDLKPTNIVVSRHGEPMLLDFGLAKLLDGDSNHSALKTVAGWTRGGTEDWMSPEQKRGEELTPRSDIYALGLVLREILKDSPADLPEESLRDTELVVAKALQVNPADRFQTVQELIKKLDAVLARKPVSISLPETVARKRRLSRRLVVAGVSVVIVTVVLFGVYQKRRVAAETTASETETQRLKADTARKLTEFRQFTIDNCIKNAAADNSLNRSIAENRARRDDPKAKAALGFCYIYLRDGALKTLQAGKNEMAEAFLREVTDQDARRGFGWLRSLAKGGWGRGSAIVSGMLASGRGGIQQNKWEAFRFANLAQEQGEVDGYRLLGDYYSLGFGAPKDSAKAFEHWLKAAERDELRSQVNVARIYWTGIPPILKKNLGRAYMWAYIAASNPQGLVRGAVDVAELNEEARSQANEIFGKIAGEITAEEILEAKRQAEEWIKEHRSAKDGRPAGRERTHPTSTL